MAKWKKKLRKFAKKAIPAIGLGLAATALARRRATDAPGDAMAAAKKAMTTDRAYTGGGYTDPIMTGGVGVKPSRLRTWTGDQSMTNTDPFNYYKKGGRVKGCGIAKRGVGRAMKKGRK